MMTEGCISQSLPSNGDGHLQLTSQHRGIQTEISQSAGERRPHHGTIDIIDLANNKLLTICCAGKRQNQIGDHKANKQTNNHNK